MAQIFYLDANGLACPQPVLKVKTLLDNGHQGPLTVGLDNEGSAINVAAFLQGVGLKTQTYQQEDHWLVLGHTGDAREILVWYGPDGWQAAIDEHASDDEIIDLKSPISMGEPSMEPAGAPLTVGRNACGSEESPVAVMVSSEFMGAGDEVLGAKLAVNFFDTLAALGQPPQVIAFYNSGVRLTTRDSSIVEALRDLISQGSTVISSGVCLEHFKVKEELKVGRIGNMYEIINAQRNAERVVRM